MKEAGSLPPPTWEFTIICNSIHYILVRVDHLASNSHYNSLIWTPSRQRFVHRTHANTTRLHTLEWHITLWNSNHTTVTSLSQINYEYVYIHSTIITYINMHVQVYVTLLHSSRPLQVHVCTVCTCVKSLIWIDTSNNATSANVVSDFL